MRWTILINSHIMDYKFNVTDTTADTGIWEKEIDAMVEGYRK